LFGVQTSSTKSVRSIFDQDSSIKIFHSVFI